MQRKLSNDEILTNINNIFKYSHMCQDNNCTIESLGFNELTGGNIVPRRARYVEYEKQLGGAFNGIEKIKSIIGINKNKPEEESLTLSEFEKETIQQGGNLHNNNETSDMFMSEINKINNLSATSQPIENVQQKPTEQTISLSLKTLSSPIIQTGGCNCTMSGGKVKQTSEEINVMPFYSSTSVEYYGNMQKEHRYT